MRICSLLASYIPSVPAPVKNAASRTAALVQEHANLGNFSFAAGLFYYYATGNVSGLYAGTGGLLGYLRGKGAEGRFMLWLMPDPPEIPAQPEPPPPPPWIPPTCGISFDLITVRERLIEIRAKETVNTYDIYNLAIWSVKSKTPHPANPANREPLAENEFRTLLEHFGISREEYFDLWPRAKTHEAEIYRKLFGRAPRLSRQIRYMIDHYPQHYANALADIRYRLFLEKARHRQTLLSYCPNQ